MWAHRTLRVDVKNFVPMRHQPIRDDHTMTAEIHTLGAHIRGARDPGDLEQFGGSLLELGRQRVVGIIAKAGIAQRRMRRVFVSPCDTRQALWSSCIEYLARAANAP